MIFAYILGGFMAAFVILLGFAVFSTPGEDY